MVPNRVRIVIWLLGIEALLGILSGIITLTGLNTNPYYEEKLNYDILKIKKDIQLEERTIEESKDAVFPQRNYAIKTRDKARRQLEALLQEKENLPKMRMWMNVGASISIVCGIILVVLASQLLNLKQWARVSVIVIIGLNILVNILALFRGSMTPLFGIALCGIIIYCLCNKESREAFARGSSSMVEQ